MRIDPDPGGSELQLIGQYLDYQRETALLRTDGLTGEQLVQKLLPSDLTLGDLPMRCLWRRPGCTGWASTLAELRFALGSARTSF